jgi:ligand-binding sensor domain-containing protein
MDMRKLIFLFSFVISLYSCEKANHDDKIPGEINSNFNLKILDGYFVTSMAFDSEGNAWIGTFKQGLIKYNSKETVVYNSSNSILPENLVIWDIAVDSKDNIWMGCGGLMKFDGENFTLYNSANTVIPEDFVYSIAIDSKDNIWFTSCRFRQGGIVKYDGTNWKVFTPGNSDLPVNFVQSIAIDNNDNPWLALGEIVNNASIVKISDRNWTIYSDEDLGFSPYYFGNIQVNSKNQICGAIDYSLSSTMVNSGPQVFIFSGNKCEQLQFDMKTRVKSLTIDREDNIWCVTSNGYAVYNGEKWVVDDSTFKKVSVFALEQSLDNKIWIGTGNGIYINN